VNCPVDGTTVVVTGIGVLTSVGCTQQTFWDSLTQGRSGVERIQSFDPSAHASQMAAEIRDFDPEAFMSRKQARRMARVSQLASAAAVQAAQNAGLDLPGDRPERVGCVIGSAAGDYAILEEQHQRFLERGPGAINPLSIPKIIPNMPAANAAIVLGVTGPNLGPCAACASGAYAIGIAFDMLRLGRADVVLAGGAEAAITPMVVDAYGCMSVLSQRNDDPAGASRPFDAGRDGFVIGEGSGVLALETLEHARARGATPLAVLAGCGMTSDAHNIALPEPEGRWAAAAMEQALAESQLNPDQLGYINAHGTSTKVNDRIEALAIHRVFGNRPVPVSSTKSMIGHTLGAAGAIEAAAAALAVRHGVLPPTINYQSPDPECDLDVIPNQAREVSIDAAMSNAFGFGGQNAAVVFRSI
jgi:3-oxoacyl-[acyl-carrier-protein] synthase II